MTNWKINPNNNSGNLKEILNRKYGKREFSMNLRTVCLSDFKRVIADFCPIFNRALLVGANNFAEVDLLPDFKILAGVDLAYSSFDFIKTNRENTIPIIANADSLPFPDNYFDQYCSFRTLFSEHTDLARSLQEADRVTGSDGQIIVSVPNGYLEEGIIIKGMYDYSTDKYDLNKPYEYAAKVASYFKSKRYSVRISEITSEIIISIQK